MKTAAIVLALVIVLGFVRETTAADCSIRVGGRLFGIVDETDPFSPPNTPITVTQVYVGPLGDFEVPFTATKGLFGFCVIAIGLVALVTVVSVRWKRKRMS
jgi:hypothetical protein